MTASSAIYLALLLAAITLLVLYSRNGKLIKSVLFTVFTGFAALGTVIIISRFTGLNIAVTPVSLLVSGVLGIPGVLGLLILNLI